MRKYAETGKSPVMERPSRMIFDTTVDTCGVAIATVKFRESEELTAAFMLRMLWIILWRPRQVGPYFYPEVS